MTPARPTDLERRARARLREREGTPLTTTRTQPPAGRHAWRLQRFQEIVETLPAYSGELGDGVQHLPEEQLLERNPTQPAPRIDALNMTTLYGERTDGCGTVGCLAALTILAYPEEAAEVRSRIARERTVSEHIISMFEVATRVLGLDEETRDARFFGLGTDLTEDFAKIPKRAVLAALDHAIAGTSGNAIWHGTGTPPRT